MFLEQNNIFRKSDALETASSTSHRESIPNANSRLQRPIRLAAKADMH